jgi:sugar lactone lactonase YvrE
MRAFTRASVFSLMIAALLTVSPALAQTVITSAGTGSPGYSGDNGFATSAQIDTVYGVAIDSRGNTYLADSRNHRVRKIYNGVITTVAGNGQEGFSGDGGAATSAQLAFPRDVAVDAQGNLYIADTGNSRIRKVTSSGVISTIAGDGTAGFAGDGGPAAGAQLSYPAGLTVDTAGNIYIADSWNYRIRKIATNGNIQTIVGNGSYGPFGDGGPAVDASLGLVESLAVNAAGDLFLSDSYNHVVRKVSSGVISTVVGGGFGVGVDGASAATANLKFPKGIAVDWQGNLLISDSMNHRVRKVTPGGLISTVAGRGTPGYAGDGAAATSAQIDAPSGVAVDSQGNLTFSDQWNYRVRSVGGTLVSVSSRFVPVPPCRVLDTRNDDGTFGGPTMDAGTSRTFPIPQSPCGIPATAEAYSVNVTVVPGGVLPYLTAWPAGQTRPGVSTLNSFDGRVVANAAIVPAGINGAIGIYVAGETDVIVDINGYFTADGSGNPFFTLAPCRVADTRNASGPLGGPDMMGPVSRSFPLSSSACSIPSGVQAYSINATVVPQGRLGYLTLWPTGQSQPFVSTLNSFDGQVVANAAILPAGNSGAVSAYVTNPTSLILDINGYFGAPSSGEALSFYPLAPCRIADTRGSAGTFGGPSMSGGTARDFPIPSSGCGVPAGARAYSLNVTVVPKGPLSYLTLWPTGQARPWVSTLNSFTGRVVANAAIVPAGTGGAVSVYVTGATDVILDINGYFAP